MATVELLKGWLENCPPAQPARAPDLAGFTVDGFQVCEPCAGRLLARACRLGDNVAPIWDGAVKCGLCGKEHKAAS